MLFGYESETLWDIVHFGLTTEIRANPDDSGQTDVSKSDQARRVLRIIREKYVKGISTDGQYVVNTIVGATTVKGVWHEGEIEEDININGDAGNSFYPFQQVSLTHEPAEEKGSGMYRVTEEWIAITDWTTFDWTTAGG